MYAESIWLLPDSDRLYFDEFVQSFFFSPNIWLCKVQFNFQQFSRTAATSAESAVYVCYQCIKFK